MGIAAYNRASRVIGQRIAADYANPNKVADLDVNRVEMQARRIKELEQQVAGLERELGRARRLIRALQASKTDLWERIRAATSRGDGFKRALARWQPVCYFW